jgi:hypothetical protein
MKRVTVLTAVVFLGVMSAPLPSKAAVKDHALYKVAKAVSFAPVATAKVLTSPVTYRKVAYVVVAGVEAGVDGLWAGTVVAERVVKYTHTPLEKAEGALEGSN